MSEGTIISLVVGIVGIISGALAWVITLATTRALLMQHLIDCKTYRETTASELAAMRTNQTAILSEVGQVRGAISASIDRRWAQAGGLT